MLIFGVSLIVLVFFLYSLASMQIRHGHQVGYYFMGGVEQSEEVKQIPNHHPKLQSKQYGTWVGNQVSHIIGSNNF